MLSIGGKSPVKKNSSEYITKCDTYPQNPLPEMATWVVIKGCQYIYEWTMTQRVTPIGTKRY